MHAFRRGTEADYAERQPGVWHVVGVERYVAAICPLCRFVAVLCCLTRPEKADHAIAEDGMVSPSVGCPNAPCAFHEYVRLDGWVPSDSGLTI